MDYETVNQLDPYSAACLDFLLVVRMVAWKVCWRVKMTDLLLGSVLDDLLDSELATLTDIQTGYQLDLAMALNLGSLMVALKVDMLVSLLDVEKENGKDIQSVSLKDFQMVVS